MTVSTYDTESQVTIAIANAKGGVGKTTTALHLSVALARQGYNTLAIDTDAQHTLTRHLRVSPHSRPTMRDLLFNGLSVHDVALEVRDNLRVVPSSLTLANADVALSQLPASDLRLHKAMNDPDWDVCIIDCPPSLGKPCVNALVAATHFLVPIDSAPYALEGLDMRMQTVDEARSYYNPDLRFLGNVLTLYDNTRISKQVLEEVKPRGPRDTFRTTIRRSTRVKEAAAYGGTTFDASGGEGISDDYEALTQELIQRAGGKRYAVT